MQLIPLHRVLTDANDRFQRFGANDSQLYGKPLLNFASQLPARTVRTQAQPQEEPEGLGMLGAEPSRAGATAVPAFPAQSEKQLGAGSVPKPGSYLDVKA